MPLTILGMAVFTALSHILSHITFLWCILCSHALPRDVLVKRLINMGLGKRMRDTLHESGPRVLIGNAKVSF